MNDQQGNDHYQSLSRKYEKMLIEDGDRISSSDALANYNELAVIDEHFREIGSVIAQLRARRAKLYKVAPKSDKLRALLTAFPVGVEFTTKEARQALDAAGVFFNDERTQAIEVATTTSTKHFERLGHAKYRRVEVFA